MSKISQQISSVAGWCHTTQLQKCNFCFSCNAGLLKTHSSCCARQSQERLLRAATETRETLLDVCSAIKKGGGGTAGVGRRLGHFDIWDEGNITAASAQTPGVCAWACNAKRQNRWNAGADTGSTKAGQVAHIFAYVHVFVQKTPLQLLSACIRNKKQWLKVFISSVSKYSLFLLSDDEKHFVLCFYLSSEFLVRSPAGRRQSQGIVITK